MNPPGVLNLCAHFHITSSVFSLSLKLLEFYFLFFPCFSSLLLFPKFSSPGCPPLPLSIPFSRMSILYFVSFPYL